MGNWSTLNKGQITSTKDAVEIQVERLLEQYQETLKLHQKGQHESAKQTYQELVSHTLLMNEPKPKKKVGTNVDVIEESPLSTLRFLVFKNYASLLKEQFSDTQDKTTANEALQYYLQAVKIDPTEYSLWYHIGYLAHTIKKLRFARLAFETGFYVTNQQRTLKLHMAQPDQVLKTVKSGQYTPMQWKCLEGLVKVLYDIGDYALCQTYINIVMSLVADWQVGLDLKSKMDLEKQNDIAMIVTEQDTMMEDAHKTVDITLEKPAWPALLDSLLKQYKRVEKEAEDEEQDKEKLKSIETFVNQAIHITLEKEEEEEKVEESATVERMEEEPQVPGPAIASETTTEPAKDDIPMDVAPFNIFSSNVIVIDDDDDDVDVPMREETPSSAKKRKREDDESAMNEESNAAMDQDKSNKSDHEEEGEEEEEDEAEEKRLSLRASKRQRDKIAIEETSRFKMLEEEKEFTDKVQDFYDKLKHLPKLYRQAPWYKSTTSQSDSETALFLEWFDHKISELDHTRCWDVERESKQDTSSALGDAKGNNIALFSKSPASSEAEKKPSTITNTATVKAFITELNKNNSGITDSLCKLILAIIQYDPISTNENTTPITIMSNEFLDLITDTITTLESNFVECILSDATTSATQKLMIITRINEYLTDRLIRITMATAKDKTIHKTTNTSGVKKKISTSLAKAQQLKLLANLNEHCTYWMNLLERTMFDVSLENSFPEIRSSSSSNSNDDDLMDTSNVVNDDSKEGTENMAITLRYWILNGKLAQCNDAIEEAHAWYSKCKSVVEATTETISVNIKSMYDSILDLAHLNSKLELLQVGKMFAIARQKLELKNFEGVIEDLEPVIQSKSLDVSATNATIQMMDILAKAYVETDRKLKAWNCYIKIFCYAVNRLVNYGTERFGSATKDEDNVEFFKLLTLINHVTSHMTLLLEGPGKNSKSLEDWLPKDINEDLSDKLCTVLRMSIYYIFRHPDFVPLVNNFTNDLPPHKPAKSTKHNGFNDLMVQAWVLQTHLLQHAIQDDKGEVMISWVDVFQTLHDELGEREVCGAAKGALLQHLMRTLVRVDDKKYRNEIYQCYHCLYGKHLAAETDVIEEHHCVHNHLDQKAAEPLFALVVDAVVEKLQHGTILKTDLKDVIDSVSELFEDLPLTNSLVKANKIIIDDYLKGDLQLYSSMDKMLRTAIIPTTLIDSEKTKTSMVYYKIFWIRGKSLRILIKNRAKANNEKTMTDLETAIEEFTNHLILSPDDADGWAELGTCYQLLAEEELSWSASNIKSRRDTIAEYQRKSCHAYLRSIYLLQQDKELMAASIKKQKKNHKNEMFINFGHLVYSVASSPIHMEAFKPSSSTVKKKRVGMAKDGSLTEIQEKPPSSNLAYKLALMMYNQALAYKVHDEVEWRCFYMIGKCLTKIGRPPKEVLGWFLKAICSTRSKKNVSSSSSSHGKSHTSNVEPILEPIYIFCSYLAKYLYAGKIEPKDVEEFLARERLLHQPASASSVAGGTGGTVAATTAMETQNEAEQQEMISLSDNGPEASTSALMEELQLYSTHLPAETAHAYNAVFQRLEEIRVADKKSTHHRPFYRISWMYYHVYRNIELAKAELMKLFPLKVLTKTYIHIWISGFELPGKHFEYHHKYTLFLIELAKESNDALTLKYLYKKLRRAPNLLLEDKKVFQLAYNAYIEVIRLNIRSIHHAKTYMKMIKESKMSTDDFQSICKLSSKGIMEDKSIADPDLYSILVDLAELRKLIQGFIVGGLDDEDLNKVVRMAYAALILGGETNVSKQKELEVAVAKDETSLSKTRKDLRVVLLAEAKLFMQSVLATQK